MEKKYKKFENTLWIIVRIILYITLMVIFMEVAGQDNFAMLALSRTMGITITTFVVVGVLLLRIYGGYDIGRRKSKPIIFSLGLAVFFTDIVVYLQAMIMRTRGTSAAVFSLSKPWLVLVAFFAQLIVIIIFTYGGHAIFFRLHEPEKCFIFAKNEEAFQELLQAVATRKKQYKVVGGGLLNEEHAKKAIQGADTVFIGTLPSEYRAQLMRICYRYRKNVYIIPEVEDIMEMSSEPYQIDDMVLFNYLSKSFSFEQRVAKRLLDIILSLIIGILTLPFVLVAMIAIKLEDGGPVFYKQKRATLNGKIFNVLKLRSMSSNDKNVSAQVNDVRITKVGKVIRRLRIDEIPQIYNVLKGDMSFVGPRPEMISNVESYTEQLPEFEYRLRVKAGLTGYAQIAGKYNTTPRDKLIMDMLYIEQFSIVRDIQLIFQTIIAVLHPDSTQAFGTDGAKMQTDIPYYKDEEGISK